MNARLLHHAVSGLILLASACATLPDTSDYTAATIQVRQAAGAAGDLVQAEIGAAADGMTDEAAQRSVRESGVAFTGAWNTTLGSLDAAVAYAESIEDIAGAGNKGADSARAVADRVATLAGMLGVAIGPAGGAVTSTGAFLYGELAKVRAARSLEAALAAANPSILRLQEVIAAQLGSARTTFQRALSAQARAVDNEAALGLYPRRDAALEAEEKLRLGELTDAVLRQPDDTARIATLKARIAVITDTRAALAGGVARYEARMADLARRRQAGLAVFGAADGAVAAWAAAQTRLAAAIRDRRPVTVDSLAAATTELRAVIGQWRAL